MAALTLRLVKGSELTYAEVDNNFSALNTELGTRAPAASPSFTGQMTYGGVTLNSAVTGTGNMVLSSSPTLTTPTLTNPTITNYTETVLAANTGTAITLSLATGTIKNLTLTGSPTITMPTIESGKSFIMYLRTGGGGNTVTWSTVKWAGGTAPTITSTTARLDIFSFFCDGINWYGVIVGQNYTP